ncbi:uncharacterized protein LOC116340805 isoform X2 [Contarinia nasturtii]|uniref:uncharacterized protein LOC116340805 isoform X2 n=1 Tax=Contarinia nasturtii TaxID=265458 RepID=UPI0012D396F7|nr:uncharacterized protein LOC116340805 isoform X2 [Contarinia nasturtii]
MTHFRPICLMPLSVSNNSADKIVSVPPLRQKNVKKDILKIYKPIKTKFRKKLTSVRRKSAFVIFQAIKPLLNAGKLLTGGTSVGAKATISKPLLAEADSQSEATQDMFDTSTSSEELRNNDTTTTRTIANNGRSQKTAKTVQTRKTSKCCDSTRTRSNREKMLQEKEDFQLAKMLQECVGTTDDAPSRYSLRSRNKSSVSSLSSTSSSQELFHSKGYSVGATPKFKKTIPFGADTTKDSTVARGNSQRNNDEKFIDFSFQKLTRSRRIAMTMTGV